MIDKVCVFSKGGLVLWSKDYYKIKGNPVDALIKNVLLQERTGQDIFTVESYNCKWTLANECDLVFVVSNSCRSYYFFLPILYFFPLLPLHPLSSLLLPAASTNPKKKKKMKKK